MNREEIIFKIAMSLVDEINADYCDEDKNPLYRKEDMIRACTEMAEQVQARYRNDLWDDFVEGANWMQEQMLERACEWISIELMRSQSHDDYANVDMIKFVEDFKQAMKKDLNVVR